MLAHAALFLSHTTTMDDMPLGGFRPGDAADSRHRNPFWKRAERCCSRPRASSENEFSYRSKAKSRLCPAVTTGDRSRLIKWPACTFEGKPSPAGMVSVTCALKIRGVN